MSDQTVQFFDVTYKLDVNDLIYCGKVMSRSPEREDILRSMGRYVSPARINLLSVCPTRRRTPRRQTAVKSAIYKRSVPREWASDTVARTDMSLDVATDARVHTFEVEAVGRWVAMIDMEDARNALARHPLRKSALMPFNIDIAASAIEGAPVKMSIIRLRAA